MSRHSPPAATGEPAIGSVGRVPGRPGPPRPASLLGREWRGADAAQGAVYKDSARRRRSSYQADADAKLNRLRDRRIAMSWRPGSCGRHPVDDPERVPAVGPVILAPNHASSSTTSSSASRCGARSSSWPSRSCSRRRGQDLLAAACSGAARLRRPGGVRDRGARAPRGGVVAMYAKAAAPNRRAVRQAPPGDRPPALLSGAPVVPSPSTAHTACATGSGAVPEDPRLLRRAVRLRTHLSDDPRIRAGRRRGIFGEVRELYADTRPGSAPGSTWA